MALAPPGAPRHALVTPVSAPRRGGFDALTGHLLGRANDVHLDLEERPPRSRATEEAIGAQALAPFGDLGQRIRKVIEQFDVADVSRRVLCVLARLVEA